MSIPRLEAVVQRPVALTIFRFLVNHHSGEPMIAAKI